MRPGRGLVPEELAFPLGTPQWFTQWVRLALVILGTEIREKTVAWVGRAEVP